MSAKLRSVGALTSSSGFVADLLAGRPRVVCQTKPWKKRVAFATVIAITSICLLALRTEIPPNAENVPESGGATSRPYNNSYELKAYALNLTLMTPSQLNTTLVFDESQLPFLFETLTFGDFREESAFSCRYFGGMSLLVKAAGASTNITFRESNGRLIQEIWYQGQPLIVLSGWEYVSWDSDGSVMERTWGSMQTVAYDWKEGAWTPSNGIVVEHPRDFTVKGAQLCVMVFEPVPGSAIPEFGFMPVCLVVAALMILIRRQVAEPSRNGSCDRLTGPYPISQPSLAAVRLTRRDSIQHEHQPLDLERA